MEFEEIIKEIINNEKFKELKNIKQHGRKNTRYMHCYNVAKETYYKCKKKNLDYISATKAALLHDFYNEHYNNLLKRIVLFFNHGNKSLENSLKYYNLSEKEKNIIASHMFPATYVIPKYKESIIVSLMDKKIAFKEIIDNLKK